MKYKNDASFVFGQDLYMFEQQSSRNPNMPLRFLHYLSDVYRQMYNNSDLHRSTTLKIPVPHFVTFYNGKQPLEAESILRLSDMYEKEIDCPELELMVRVININTGAIINKNYWTLKRMILLMVLINQMSFIILIIKSVQITLIHLHSALNFFLNAKLLRTI